MTLKDYLKTNRKPFYLDGQSVRPCWKNYLFKGTELDMKYLKLWENLEILNESEKNGKKTLVLAPWSEYSLAEKKLAVLESYRRFSKWADDADIRVCAEHNISLDQLYEWLDEGL